MKGALLPSLAALALVFAALSVAQMQQLHRQEPAAPLRTPPAAATSAGVAAIGLVEPASELIELGTTLPGLVTEVAVEAGDRVAAGTPLFVIDPREVDAQLQVARAARAAAAERLRRLQAEPRPENLPPARARVRAAEAELRDARLQLRNLEAVDDPRAVRQEDLDRRRLASLGAAARLDEARSQLALLEAGAWRADRAIAAAELAQAEAEVQRLEVERDRHTVRAPIAGEILRVNLRAGEYAEARALETPLILMGDTTTLHVRAEIDEYDSGRLQGTTTAIASPRGEGGRRLQLEPVRIEPYVLPKRSLSGVGVERVDTRVLQVLFRVRPDGRPLRVGQQVDVYIDAAQEGGS